MAERFTVTLKQIIDEFRLEVLYCPGDPADILVSENDITRPGLQLMGFYEYFNPERIQIIGKWNLHISPRSRRMSVFRI